MHGVQPAEKDHAHKSGAKQAFAPAPPDIAARIRIQHGLQPFEQPDARNQPVP